MSLGLKSMHSPIRTAMETVSDYMAFFGLPRVPKNRPAGKFWMARYVLATEIV